MNADENNFFEPKAFLTGLTSVTFLYGIIYLSVFSSCFNFNLFDFLDLGEVISSIIKNVVIIGPVYTLGIVSGIFIGKKAVQIRNDIENKATAKKLSTNIFIVINILIFIFLAMSILLNYINRISDERFFLFVTISMMFLAGMYFLKLRKKFIFISSNTISPKTEIRVVILTIVVSLAVINALLNVDYIKNFKTTFGTYLITKTDTIKSDSNYYFICKTSKFYLFYNQKKKTVDVFPEKEMSKFSIH